MICIFIYKEISQAVCNTNQSSLFKAKNDNWISYSPRELWIIGQTFSWSSMKSLKGKKKILTYPT